MGFAVLTMIGRTYYRATYTKLKDKMNKTYRIEWSENYSATFTSADIEAFKVSHAEDIADFTEANDDECDDEQIIYLMRDDLLENGEPNYLGLQNESIEEVEEMGPFDANCVTGCKPGDHQCMPEEVEQ